MLRGLIEQHGIPLPAEAGIFGPTAKVAMLDVPGGHPRLQVIMPETAPDRLAGFDSSCSSIPLDSSNPDPTDLEVDAQPIFDLPATQPGVPSVPPPALRKGLPSKNVQIHRPATSSTPLTEKVLPPSPNFAPPRPVCHLSGLDAAQIGIDFVLALEHPCLHHTRSDLESTGSYGHILTAQAPLLTHAPRPLQPTSSWTIPAVEIERLLNLSGQLNLDGELTPIQAWARIRSYPGFERLNLDQLETLKQALLKEVHCYGYVTCRSNPGFPLPLA